MTDRELEKSQQHPRNTRKTKEGRRTSNIEQPIDALKKQWSADYELPLWQCRRRGRRRGRTWVKSRKTERASKIWMCAVFWETNADLWRYYAILRVSVRTNITTHTLWCCCVFDFHPSKSLWLDLFRSSDIKKYWCHCLPTLRCQKSTLANTQLF